MRIKAICGIAGCFFALAAWAQQTTVPPKPAAPGFRVSGQVVSAATGQALARALVNLLPTEQHAPPQSVESDDSGNFRFASVTSGKWQLIAQAPGFVRQSFNEHGMFSSAVAVGPELESENLVFRLRPDAVISGVITDEAGDPIREAEITLFRSGMEGGTRRTITQERTGTDDLGHYRFAHLPPGAYFIAVSAIPWYAQRPGSDPAEGTPPSPLDVTYPITLQDGTTDPDQATPLALKPGDHAVADVTLSAVPALHVRIAGAPHDLQQGFNTQLSERLFDGVSLPVESSSSEVGDSIELDGVPPGRFEMTLETQGQTPGNSRQTINIADDSEITVAASSSFIPVSGAAQLDGALAPSGTSIILRDSTTGNNEAAPVGDKGRFVVDGGLAPGSYQVFVSTPENVAEVQGVAASGAKVTGEHIEISGGAPVQLAVVLTRHWARIDGVALRDGKPLAGVMVMLVPQDLENNPLLVRRDQSDSDGTFSLYRVLPGRYVVLALSKGWDMEWMKASEIKPYLAGGEVVQITGEGRVKIKVKVQ